MCRQSIFTSACSRSEANDVQSLSGSRMTSERDEIVDFYAF
jgi:hypothetical protein